MHGHPPHLRTHGALAAALAVLIPACTGTLPDDFGRGEAIGYDGAAVEFENPVVLVVELSAGDSTDETETFGRWTLDILRLPYRFALWETSNEVSGFIPYEVFRDEDEHFVDAWIQVGGSTGVSEGSWGVNNLAYPSDESPLNFELELREAAWCSGELVFARCTN